MNLSLHGLELACTNYSSPVENPITGADWLMLMSIIHNTERQPWPKLDSLKQTLLWVVKQIVLNNYFNEQQIVKTNLTTDEKRDLDIISNANVS